MKQVINLVSFLKLPVFNFIPSKVKNNYRRGAMSLMVTAQHGFIFALGLQA